MLSGKLDILICAKLESHWHNQPTFHLLLSPFSTLEGEG